MCDHLGHYTLLTRHVNKVPIRLYHCHTCNAQMAMDSLPQHLLRRMWGNIEHGPLLHGRDLPPIDFCVIISGKNALQLCRVFFWSLLRTAGTLEGITFHLVNNGVSGEEFDAVCQLMLKYKGSKKHYISPPMGLNDVMEWEMENCGTAKYVVLSHFDLFFAKDWVNRLRSMITPKTGQLGSHCPFLLLSREAFAQSKIKFNSLPQFRMVPDGGNCDIFTLDDPRGKDGYLLGFDTGDCLELELRCRGWEVNPMRGPGLGDETAEVMYHFYGGARVTPDLNDGSEFLRIQKRAQMFIEEYNIS